MRGSGGGGRGSEGSRSPLQNANNCIYIYMYKITKNMSETPPSFRETLKTVETPTTLTPGKKFRICACNKKIRLHCLFFFNLN